MTDIGPGNARQDRTRLGLAKKNQFKLDQIKIRLLSYFVSAELCRFVYVCVCVCCGFAPESHVRRDSWGLIRNRTGR